MFEEFVGRIAFQPGHFDSAIAFFNAADRVEEIAEGELHELHPASLGLVTSDEGWMSSL